jgi:anti-anti-sigma factor
MLRITRGITADDKAIELLRLDGQVAGRWVEELRRECDEVLAADPDSGRPLVLDLAGVSFIDADGIALFQDLVTRRVSLANGSLFVTEQLKEVVHGKC